MGMFDNITCKYPLPDKSVQDVTFQTKDTPAQLLANYEIREDGTLWFETFDTRIEENQEAVFGFYMVRENLNWVFLEKFTGEIAFYTFDSSKKWIEFSSYFVNGKIQSLVKLDGE